MVVLLEFCNDNNIDNDYEFKFMNDYYVEYLDLGFDEEDFRCYFFILGDR